MKTLLHICCGPCACYSVEALRADGHEVTGYWYNPNIHPVTENRKRLEAAEQLAQIDDFSMIIDNEYPLEQWLANVADNPQNRCGYCYRVRLTACATVAKREGFDAFTTTLLYSRYQKHDLIRQTAEQIAQEVGVPFLYKDLRVGWSRGITLSKKKGLYRQQYCGCIYSEKDRYWRENG